VAAARAVSGEQGVTRILSGDLPRSRVLATLLIVICIGLVAAPFVFPGARSLNVAAKVAVFVLLVASYDLLLGYTGIVSFAHTMFFGIGGYGIAIAAAKLGPAWGNLALGFIASLALALAIALVIGLLSLRVRTIFFAMITLAVASFFQILASQLRISPAARTASTSGCRRCCRTGSPATTWCSRRRRRSSCACCASSTRPLAGCCSRSARTSSAPRRSAIAPSSIAPPRTA
jgi:hypothetical protein